MGHLLGESEDVPAQKKYMISTRENSTYKWQDKGCIGAIEVPSEPELDLKVEYVPRHVSGKETLFDQALELWNERKWRDDFIKACENVPKATFCCGLLPDDDQTIKDIQKKLNKGWIKAMNQQLRSERKDFIMDCHIWSWHNATGKSLTLILLVRFFESPRRSIMKDDDLSELLEMEEPRHHKRKKDARAENVEEEVRESES